jgi:hypothetical protein
VPEVGADSAYDRSLARRAAAIGGVSTLVAGVVVAATDAGGPWAQRLGMTAALAPLCGAAGTLATVRIAAARGEILALAAVGAGPARALLGAVAGGSAVGLLGAIVAASGAADLGPLFPRPPAARIWVVEGGALHEITLGLRAGAHGELAIEAPRAAVTGLPAGAAAFTILALAVAALACPAWIAALPGATPARRAVVGVTAILAAIVAFQGVAAARLPAIALVVAPLLLLGDAALAGAMLERRGRRREPGARA